MNKNIIISGVGGQGILTIASIIDLAAMHAGLKVKQAEVHGMSQRGGEVQSHLRISDREIYSDLIGKGKADLILSVEPLEALRYLPYLSPRGIVVTAIEPFINIDNYPCETEIYDSLKESAHTIFVDATKIAREVGNPKSYNIVMLGAATHAIGIDQNELEWGIRELFVRKGNDVVELNIQAYRKGIESAK